ncbi:hypothetical protein F0562_012864 [Nyssa sinensis]|uniref:Uncharacterized protein n=1 Tax=Nyssa sinensis TaxID=561372 RepID=A0A5J4ZYQ4_9ASTE|nr:hypothetical protein F0562_012864 [Nyssa sinensis]
MPVATPSMASSSTVQSISTTGMLARKKEIQSILSIIVQRVNLLLILIALSLRGTARRRVIDGLSIINSSGYESQSQSHVGGTERGTRSKAGKLQWGNGDLICFNHR